MRLQRLLQAMVIAGCMVAAGCSGTREPVMPSGAKAYEVIPEGDVMQARDYPIGPLDVLAITVFREPDLSVEKAQVDSDGLVQMPLVGPVSASGMTSSQLARSIEQVLGRRYLVDPKVTVAIVESARRRVTVDGAVTQPGVYEMPGRISLVDAVALARGATDVAKYEQVAVIRRVNGRRMGGVFDLSRIQAGIDPDPEIVAGDQVVVGTSAIRSAYRDLLRAAPFIGLFQYF